MIIALLLLCLWSFRRRECAARSGEDGSMGFARFRKAGPHWSIVLGSVTFQKLITRPHAEEAWSTGRWWRSPPPFDGRKWLGASLRSGRGFSVHFTASRRNAALFTMGRELALFTCRSRRSWTLWKIPRPRKLFPSIESEWLNNT